MTRQRKRFSLMPAIALAALGALVAIPALSSSRLYAASPAHFTSVTVRSGQTLWSLAAAHTADDASVQETVETIMAANHLTGAALTPGQHLRIPQ